MATPHTQVPVSAASPTSRAMLAVAIVAGHAVKHLLNAGFFVLLPEVKVGLGLTNAGIGTIAATRNVASGLTNLPAGFAADRFQGQGATMLGIIIILVGLFTAALGFSDSFLAALAFATLGGMAITSWHPTAISALSRRFPERRGFAIALHGTGGSIGEALGPLLVGGLLLVLGWRLVFESVGVSSMLGGVAVWLMLQRTWGNRTDATATIAVYLRSVQELLGNRRILILLVMVVGYSATQSAIITFLPIYIQLDVGYSASVMSLYIAASQIAGILSQPAMGFLSDRYGRKQVLVPGLLLLGIAAMAIAVASPGVLLFVVVVLMGAVQFPLMSIFLAAVSDIAGENVQGTVVSLVFGVTMVIAGVSPYIGGLLADTYGVKSVFLYSAGPSLLSAFLLVLQRWPKASRAASG